MDRYRAKGREESELRGIEVTIRLESVNHRSCLSSASGARLLHRPASMIDKESLFARLEQFPGDWENRLALIELAIREDDLPGAKRLVRAAPPHVATPPEIQVRLHALLTRGKEALAPLAPSPVPAEPVPAETSGTPVPVETAAPGPPSPAPAPAPAPVAASAGTEGGLAALVEADVAIPARQRQGARVSSRASRHAPKAPPPIDRRAGREKWNDYDGGLKIVDLDPPETHERPTSAPERGSSLSLALFAHVALIVILSLVAVEVSRPDPPQLVVSVIHEREAELVTTRITRPTPEVKPSAASAQSVDVITSVSASSTFNVPEVENPSDTLITSTMTGVAPAGTGMSFSTAAVDSSDVNFFGLSGSGRKIVFIIDATPEMLVDEKGGMSAYNKVKDEVGIMLANLNRGTHFNLLLYQGKEVVAFRPEMVPGLPSNLRQAIEWLDPLNRDYGALGLRGDFGTPVEVTTNEKLPIAAIDVAHYTKAVQKALEWQASAIFCITAGYRGMARAPTPEMLEKMAKMPPADPGTIDPREQEAWQKAVAKTREWLEKENAARRGKGLDPKVVTNFGQLVREITGATPPQRRGGNDGGNAMPGMPDVTPEDIERQVDLLVKWQFKEQGHEEPSVHLVLFLGEEEEIADAEEDHFKALTRKNRGKLKVLRGLAALKNVTGAGSE